jgi:hypothetical protein
MQAARHFGDAGALPITQGVRIVPNTLTEKIL